MNLRQLLLKLERLKKVDPNKGYGRPGSLQWHELHIEGCATVKDLNDYIKDVTGKPLITRDELLKKAKEAIVEHLNDQSK